MNVLVVVNDQPYGSERSYNALRLAGALSKRDDADLRVFLMGDAVACAVAGHQLPDGHYHLDRMLKDSCAARRSPAAGPAWTRAASPSNCSSTERGARHSRSSPTGRCGPTRRSSSDSQRGHSGVASVLLALGSGGAFGRHARRSTGVPARDGSN